MSVGRFGNWRAGRGAHSRKHVKMLAVAVAGSIAALASAPPAALAVDGTWNVNADGSWSTAANWTSNPSVPNATGDTARFLNVITASHTITQDVAGLTLGTIEFNDDNGYTISGAEAITFDHPGDLSTVTVNNSNGNAIHTVANNLVLNDSVTVAVNTSAAFPTTFSGQISGAGGIVKTGPGHLVLRGSTANTFTESAGVTQGTLELFKSVVTPAVANALVVGQFSGTPNTAIAITKNGGVADGANVHVRRTGQFRVASGETIGQLLLNGGSVIIDAGGGDLRPSSISSQGDANTSTISGPSPLGFSHITIQVVQGTPQNDLVISAPLSGASITKTGEGTLVLTGTNNYGATTISQGTVQIGDGGFSGTMGVGAITIADNATLAFNRGGAGLTVTQAIAGGGGEVHQLGGGTFLTGNNTYSGTTNVSGGTLVIGNGGTTGTLGTGNVVTTSGGALAFQRSDNITVANNISGTGSVQHFGNGTTNLTGSVTATGPVGASAGRMILNNSMPDSHSVFGNGNGVLELASNGSKMRVIRMRNATITGTAKLDLKDNKAIITQMPIGTASGGLYSNSSVSRLLQTGSAAGAWNAPGLTTSMPDAAGGLTALGAATADQAGYAGGTFGGVSVSASDVLVMYTYAGDANLDGLVSGDDYAAIDFNAAVPGASGWSNGDFNYDGIISGDDYAAIDFNIVAQGVPFPVGAAAAPSSSIGATAVPEPASQLVLLPIFAASLRRRRTRAGQAIHSTP